MQAALRRSLTVCQELSLPLLAGVVAALAWANTAPAAYAHFLHWSPFGHGSHLNVHFLVNDVFMVLFFGLAAKEITESVLPGGALNPPSKAVNPLLATLGGVLGPVGVYFLWVGLRGSPEIANGWGIPTATDIALAWLVARLAFGPRHPAVSFLLLLAVADDGLGLGIIAIFYPDPAHPVAPGFLGLVAVAMGGAYALRRARVQSFWPYLAGPGVLSWGGLILAHLHPALALVFIVPFMPHGGHDEGLFADEGDPHGDPLNRFEHAFRLPVDVGLFAFGLVNAGVGFSSTGAATNAVLVALLVGKTVGIFGFSMAAHAVGFRLPDGMDARSLFVVGVTASLGLTVALFVAGVAFTEPSLQGAAKMGALASAVAAPLALGAARVLRVKERFDAIADDPRHADPSRPQPARAPSQPPPSLAAG